MDPEAKKILVIIAVSLPVGLLLGILLRKAAPGGSKNYIKFCIDRKWWLFLGGVILFTCMSVGSFINGKPYFGSFFAAFALFEIYALFRFGFRSITPEMEAKIDASDPTRIFPRKSDEAKDEQGSLDAVSSDSKSDGVATKEENP